MSAPALEERRRLRWGLAAAGLSLAGTLGFLWVASAPRIMVPGELPPHQPDVLNGRTIFYAASCLACHAPDPRSGRDRKLPTGDRPFATPIGTFYPGNLTPDAETGIGRWSAADFVNAVTRGVAPNGSQYLPAFPYGSFRFMRVEDVLDLRAYLASLPAVRAPHRPPSVPLLRFGRRAIGLWKRLALGSQPLGRPATRGAYLVQGPGHCGECHTPRNLLFVPDQARALAGGPHPSGEGRVPSLRGLVERGRYRDAADLALALRFGEAYGYDKLSGGGMGAIRANLAHLPESDLRAIADYLVSLE